MIVLRDYKSAIRTRGFLIGLFIAPIFMGGSFVATVIFQDRVDTSDVRMAVIDRSHVLGQSLIQAAQKRNATEIYSGTTKEKIKPAYFFELVPPDDDNPNQQRLELSDQIRAGRYFAFIEIGPDVVTLPQSTEGVHINYHSKSSVLGEHRWWLEQRINDQLRRIRLKQSGIDSVQGDRITHWIGVQNLSLISRDSENGAIKAARKTGETEIIGAPLVMLFMIFMMIMFGAAPLLSAVIEEKTHKISEVLLGSVHPFQFMMGKVLGGVAVSLTASAVYLFCAVFLVINLGLSGIAPFHVIPWFLAYLILATIMFGSFAAALGSICNDAKDAQSLAMPAMLPVMIPMFMIMPIIREPNGSLATWISFVPPFTPMIMLIRQSMPEGVPLWQPWLALCGVILFTLFSVWFGSRIFRIGIVLQGKPPRLDEVLRWAMKG
jgi:ABC-2 type transport system permease protein